MTLYTSEGTSVPAEAREVYDVPGQATRLLPFSPP